MSDEKNSAVFSTIGVASSEDCMTGVKPRPYKKYVIIAVSVVVALAIVLAAILVGVYLTTEAQTNILKFSFNMDANTKHEVTSDMNMNIVQYHVNSDGYEMWIINDFNRDIQVMKTQTKLGTECYLTPLNRTISTEPSKIGSPSGQNTTNTTYILTYHAASNPITDLGAMCETARNTCNGIPTYWLLPSCDDDYNGEASGRKRRSFWHFLKKVFKVVKVVVDVAGVGLEIAALVA